MNPSQYDRVPSDQSAGEQVWNGHIEKIGWALLLILTGSVWLVPDKQVPEGTWLIGVGLILLGINGARQLKGIRMNTCTTLLGVLALATGLGGQFVVKLPLFPIALILIGAAIIVQPWFERQRS